MARFDVYVTPFAEERKHTPFWLDVQADHLQTLGTRVVIPMRKVSAKEAIKQRLNPEFLVEETRVYADTANLGTFPLALLRQPIFSLRHERLAIGEALDFLFSGY
jgi:toxin CcdB